MSDDTENGAVPHYWADEESRGFIDDPDHPGWLYRPAMEVGRFVDLFGGIRYTVEAPDRVRCRFEVEPRHLNGKGTVHGGYVMALVDQVLFIGPIAMGIERVVGGSTVDSSTQFLAPLRAGKPIDIVVELLRETYRMYFVRGVMEQDGQSCAAFTGTVKKASAGK
ncbi:PaaI family thioesterase [Sphingomonas crocodyli]|uniref:PaaI family thioesterase n=1 Tax=Sphingomonas crocodyli TaxID=1979270 RepID=A0A437MA69_9SPHN|nr:PaaI family thioesterase [Sphingomonas crocodyli]RVT94534.1 PaaI family thioesterase [Sphingomonas crocodyli]